MASIQWTTLAEPYKDPVTAQLVSLPRYTTEVDKVRFTICSTAEGSWAVAEGSTLICDGFLAHTEAMAWVESTFAA